MLPNLFKHGSGKAEILKNAEKEPMEPINDWQTPLAFSERRHIEEVVGIETLTASWRMKERLKTVSVALVVCLNVGVDPPDIVKTQPCARLECWIDPLSMSSTKALEAIGESLQRQYERLQPRARYKQILDPTAEEVKKLCISLRRSAKDERVLFHYNGHGVPKPTTNGEIWVFNRTYTQYIPLSIYDLQSWMGTPSIYVFDCSNAGLIVELFMQFADQHEKDYEVLTHNADNQLGYVPNYKNCILLAACSTNQILPMNPDLPADLFTACLTTPIKMAVKWFYTQNSARLMPDVPLELIDKIPGQMGDRRTMLGELNWIFTAITDTIAWTLFPRDLFQKLFRQDMLLAALFRNYLLAERIMRSLNCTPVTYPVLPPTYQHPMWDAWDLAVDRCIAKLPEVLASSEPYQHSPFFQEQLTAFSVWLSQGSEFRNPPDQLPIILQVLMSQAHRCHALELLGKFLDLGPWAVNLSLSVGIFPYVLKLLQSSAREIYHPLVFIWAKILSVDISCQTDLLRENNGYKYFIPILYDSSVESDVRMLTVFVLSRIIYKFPLGQETARKERLLHVFLDLLNDPNPLLRQWLAITLANLWVDNDSTKWTAVRDQAHEKLYALLKDPVPEVRAAAVYALGTFIGGVRDRTEHANKIDQNIAMTLLNSVSSDMSPLVRKELVVALQHIVLAFETTFLSVAVQELRESAQAGHPADLAFSPMNSMKRNTSREKLKAFSPSSNYHTIDAVQLEKMKRVSSSSSISGLSMGIKHYGTVYQKLWTGLSALDSDPYPGVSGLSRIVTRYIRDKVKEQNASREVVEAKASSLPPSPSNKSYSAGSNLMSPGMGSSNEKLSRSIQLTSRSKKLVPNTINEEVADDQTKKKLLVETQFVDWSTNYFSQPILHSKNKTVDYESLEYYRREWRYLKNNEMKREAKTEVTKMSHSRIDTQFFSTKCSSPAQAVSFHPFDPHIAIAVKDNITIWDYVQNEKFLVLRGERPPGGTNAIRKICSLSYINAHHTNPLLASISDDGSVRVHSTANGNLVTAWPASPKYTNDKASFTNSSLNRGFVMDWDQTRQHFIVGGNSQFIRVWDAQQELTIADIPTGADSSVTSLSLDPSGGAMMCIGCGDGSVRIFDRRLPIHESRIMTYREHTSWVVRASFTDSQNVISGSTSGDLRGYQIKSNSPQTLCQVPSQGLKAIAIHTNADVFACGTTSQICMYRRNGISLNVMKYLSHDWFYTPRFGPVSCLEFHPFRPILAAGSADSLVTLYSGENKR